jgi:hypothetical protein
MRQRSRFLKISFCLRVAISSVSSAVAPLSSPAPAAAATAPVVIEPVLLVSSAADSVCPLPTLMFQSDDVYPPYIYKTHKIYNQKYHLEIHFPHIRYIHIIPV